MSSIANKYKDSVKKAKVLLKQRHELKYEIAKLALDSCIIKEGNCQSVSLYTLTSFAKDIGIAKGTLNRWTLEYKYIVSNLNKKDKNKINKHALNKTMGKVRADTKPSEVRAIYRSFTKYENPEDKTLGDYKKRLKSMHFFICYSAQLKKLNKEDLSAVKLYCKDMLNCVESLKSKSVIKPIGNINKAISMTQTKRK